MQILYNAAYGQFVLLFHADTIHFDYNAVGAAVSASVTGPYKFVRTFHPDGLSSYDMGTFQVCFILVPALHEQKSLSGHLAGYTQTPGLIEHTTHRYHHELSMETKAWLQLRKS